MTLPVRHTLFQSYLGEFRAGRYFEAHERLEELWIIEGRPARGPLRGLVQLAVACEHFRRGKAVGARGVFERARANLADYRAIDPSLRRFARVLAEGRCEPLPGLDSVFSN